jgi:FKBP-type peptidyl-prolyl cis-trans isomerase
MEDPMKKINIQSIIFVILIAIPAFAFAGNIVETPSGLKYEDLTLGDGKRAVPGKVATIHFTMWENDGGLKGTQLYDSYSENVPLSFKLGTKKVADGLNLGVNGMKVGGKRILYVPPELNPKKASGPFPANADLIFEVELLKID